MGALRVDQSSVWKKVEAMDAASLEVLRSSRLRVHAPGCGCSRTAGAPARGFLVETDERGPKRGASGVIKGVVGRTSPREYASDFLACEVAALGALREAGAWGGDSGRLRLAECFMRRARDLGEFCANARLVLVGDEESVGVAAWAARASANARLKALDPTWQDLEGPLPRDVAARLGAGHCHFVAAVPLGAIGLGSRRVNEAVADAGAPRRGKAVYHDGSLEAGTCWRMQDGDVVEVPMTDVAPPATHAFVAGYDDYDAGSDQIELFFPGGKRRLGERGIDAALRQCQEETSLALTRDKSGPGLLVSVLEHLGPNHVVAAIVPPGGDPPRN